MSSSITQAPNHIATVDPGWHTAVAIWSGDWVPKVETINAPRKKSTANNEDRLYYQWSRFRSLLSAQRKLTFAVDHVIIESVELWSEALVSMAAAERGDLFTLATLVGGYAAICQEYNCTFELVPAKKWKGQLTKTATQKRIDRFWHGIEIDERLLKFNEHAYDAIGIGLWHGGVF
jgi:hypothetical protein